MEFGSLSKCCEMGTEPPVKIAMSSRRSLVMAVDI